MAYQPGRNAKVTIGTATISGLGTWNMNGVTSDQIETSAFGTTWKTFVMGMKDGGTVSFEGNFDPTDDTGQTALLAANLNATEITNIRFYYNDTSYFEPCQTTGWWAADDTSGNDTIPSNIQISSYSITADKDDMVKVSFEGKVSGCIVKAN